MMKLKLKHLISLFCIGIGIQAANMAPCGISQSPCEPVKADLCKELDGNYNKTRFPIKRQSAGGGEFITQDDALLQFNSYSALVSSNCSKKLSHFLCSYYFPPCLNESCVRSDDIDIDLDIDIDDIELGPCQGLCTEVQRECEPTLIAHNLTWNFNCSEFSETQPCIDAPTSPLNPIVPRIDTCHPIKNSVCASLHPNYATFFPNINFNTHDDADLHFESFTSIINHECSDKLKLLLCSTHYPACIPSTHNRSEMNVIYPCKSVCRQVKRNCEPFLQHYNVSWPDLLNCDNFTSKKDGLCIDALESQPTCEPIDTRAKSICGVLDKNYLTHFPHGKFKTQNDAYEEFKLYLPYLEHNCSAELLPLLCYHYFPSCSPNQDEPKVPCKAVCRKARTGCEDCFKKDKSTWPDIFNCDKNYSVNKNCITLKDIEEYTHTFVNQSC